MILSFGYSAVLSSILVFPIIRQSSLSFPLLRDAGRWGRDTMSAIKSPPASKPVSPSNQIRGLLASCRMSWQKSVYLYSCSLLHDCIQTQLALASLLLTITPFTHYWLGCVCVKSVQQSTHVAVLACAWCMSALCLTYTKVGVAQNTSTGM